MRLPALCLLLLGLGCSGSSSNAPSPDPTPTGPDPATLPLLAPGQRVGVIYSSPAPAARTLLDAAFAETIAAGVDCYELSAAWTSIETSPGVIDTTYIEGLLATVQASNLVPYLVLETIDTNNLNLPPDLVDPGNANELLTGRNFDDPIIVNRFTAVLDALVPLLVQYGGFYLSFGNEVDAWLGPRPAQAASFAAFVLAARSRVHLIEPRLAVGATVTFSAIADQPNTIMLLRAASDAIAFTYYPLNGDFSVRPPADVAADFAAMRAAAQPAPLLLQEVGYPAGYSGAPGNGSSHELQRQFVANVFAELRAHPSIRMTSFLHLADWGPTDLDLFESYYGISDPRFREYLGTLGLREYADGASKPAYQEFLTGLGQM